MDWNLPIPREKCHLPTLSLRLIETFQNTAPRLLLAVIHLMSLRSTPAGLPAAVYLRLRLRFAQIRNRTLDDFSSHITAVLHHRTIPVFLAVFEPSGVA
jgi:hypothetical protein